MIVADVMKKVITYFIALLTWIAAIINSAHIITIGDSVVNVVTFNQVIITMQFNGTSGTIIDFVVTDRISYAINIDPCLVRPIDSVKIVNTTVDHLVCLRFRG